MNYNTNILTEVLKDNFKTFSKIELRFRECFILEDEFFVYVLSYDEKIKKFKQTNLSINDTYKEELKKEGKRINIRNLIPYMENSILILEVFLSFINNGYYIMYETVFGNLNTSIVLSKDDIKELQNKNNKIIFSHTILEYIITDVSITDIKEYYENIK